MKKIISVLSALALTLTVAGPAGAVKSGGWTQGCYPPAPKVLIMKHTRTITPGYIVCY